MSNGCVNWWWLATETAGVTGARDGELLWQWAQRVGWDTAAETLEEAIVSVAMAIREGERISAVMEPFVERIDRLETELAQLRAQRDWLAEQLVGARQCPETRLGRCPWTHTFGAGCCPVSMKSGTRRECWQRAAAKATEPKEATE